MTGGLKIARLLMVLSSLTPLFILWGIRGTKAVDDTIWLAICAAFVAIPNLLLLVRWRIAHSSNDERTISIRTSKDQSEHLLVYLFAMLIPLYDANLGEKRDLLAVGAAFVLIVFLFWHMNLHYMNLIFAFLGFHVFTVEAPLTTQPQEDRTRTFVVLSKRGSLAGVKSITAVRLSDTVYVERG